MTRSKQALLVASFGVLLRRSGALSHRRQRPALRRTRGARRSWTIIATHYDYSLAGRMTASGESLDPAEYAAAHGTLPLGTRLLVRYRGESVRVTVNDRGPYAAGYDIDPSLAAREIGLIGTAPVRVTVL